MGKMRALALRTGVVAAVLGVPMLLAGTANAAVGTTTTNAISNGFSDLKGVGTGTIAAAAFGIVVAFVAITMGLQALRKRGKSVN